MKLSSSTLIQLTIVLAIVGGYFLIDFNKLLQQIQGEGDYVTQNSNCDLHQGPCEITLKNGNKYSLEIFPKEIPLMKKLQFKVTSNNQKVKELDLKIYATNMYMGEFAFKLQQQADGSYSTYGTLPTCPIGNMKWNADITEASVLHKTGARFQFQTDQ